ncbi:MAG: hypothetical protein JSV56_12220 [Methanomassiliicoccales archaeon]|nr:MAG: hypothetical protein JSV56_12220 [Methanomassiliicoccales archaeon]
MQTSRIISRKDLMILLNEIYLSEKRIFNVKFPFYNINLFTVDVGGFKIRNIVTGKKYSDAREKNMPDNDFLRSDLPRFADLRDCLITSAFLPFSNYEGVSKRLIDLAQIIKSPGGRSKPLYLALDTNLVYLKFFSRYFPLKSRENDEKVTAIDFRIALSDTVKEEIDANIKYKYRASNLDRMKKSFGHPHIVNEFFNCSTRKTRMAKSAQNEIKLLFAELEAEWAKAEKFSKDKEERDRQIAKSYSNFEKERNGEVLLLTADEDMAYHAKNAGLLEETLIIPHEIVPKGEIAPNQLVDLLYDIAINFGVVRLSGQGVIIFGEWKGKSYNDYSREHLKLTIEEDSRIRDEFDRDLRIAGKIDQLS